VDNFFSPPALGWLAILAILFSIFAVLIFALQARKLFLILSAGQKDLSRKNNLGKRFASMTKEILTHSKNAELHCFWNRTLVCDDWLCSL